MDWNGINVCLKSQLPSAVACRSVLKEDWLSCFAVLVPSGILMPTCTCVKKPLASCLSAPSRGFRTPCSSTPTCSFCWSQWQLPSWWPFKTSGMGRFRNSNLLTLVSLFWELQENRLAENAHRRHRESLILRFSADSTRVTGPQGLGDSLYSGLGSSWHTWGRCDLRDSYVTSQDFCFLICEWEF